MIQEGQNEFFSRIAFRWNLLPLCFYTLSLIVLIKACLCGIIVTLVIPQHHTSTVTYYIHPIGHPGLWQASVPLWTSDLSVWQEVQTGRERSASSLELISSPNKESKTAHHIALPDLLIHCVMFSCCLLSQLRCESKSFLTQQFCKYHGLLKKKKILLDCHSSSSQQCQV